MFFPCFLLSQECCPACHWEVCTDGSVLVIIVGPFSRQVQRPPWTCPSLIKTIRRCLWGEMAWGVWCIECKNRLTLFNWHTPCQWGNAVECPYSLHILQFVHLGPTAIWFMGLMLCIGKQLEVYCIFGPFCGVNMYFQTSTDTQAKIYTHTSYYSPCCEVQQRYMKMHCEHPKAEKSGRK